MAIGWKRILVGAGVVALLGTAGYNWKSIYNTFASEKNAMEVTEVLWEGSHPADSKFGKIRYVVKGKPEQVDSLKRRIYGHAGLFSLRSGKDVSDEGVGSFYHKLDDGVKNKDGDFEIQPQELEGRFYDYTPEQAQKMNLSDIVVPRTIARPQYQGQSIPKPQPKPSPKVPAKTTHPKPGQQKPKGSSYRPHSLEM